ncbi:M48 family metalloprotease [Spirulina major CS-329]|uniref:M48 family metallopeptidase n=1 Tax=Spirulina TaxID=1154 RepID=UPI002331560D|nr:MULTISPECIES: M48 family metalloprotease [Spirulina]MDB9496578.1 M48 family metalloprotease [Spirulina subsalsa CS-330]MDB9503020.1 M48 family metalloprotease [Spirulina major CS-329]
MLPSELAQNRTEPQDSTDEQVSDEQDSTADEISDEQDSPDEQVSDDPDSAADEISDDPDSPDEQVSDDPDSAADEISDDPDSPGEQVSDEPNNTVDGAAIQVRIPRIRPETRPVFLAADEAYYVGDFDTATALYKEVKPDFAETSFSNIPDPIYEVMDLAPENLALWETATLALEEKDEAGAIAALRDLSAAEPAFLQGQVQLAQLLQAEDEEEEALALLEQLAAFYPDEPYVIKAQVEALSEANDHLEASIAAREFAMVHLDHPQAPEFEELAADEFGRFKRKYRKRSILGGILNIGINFFLRDNGNLDLDSAFETLNIVRMMLGSEADFGGQIAQYYSQDLSLVDDPEITDYITQLGLQMSQRIGRDFDYEFYVVNDRSMNATALPGGKIFVNVGAILAASSQAELAGLIAHEMAHSALSHSVQSFFRANILGQLTKEVPFGDFANALLSTHFERQQERQADVLGTRILATSGLAADGLRNFMVKLETYAQEVEEDDQIPEYLSTHPAPTERIDYLESMIQRNGYNRFALEGVEVHDQIRQKLT